MKERTFLVIGLGTLGRSVARTLAEEGARVVAVDVLKERIDLVASFVDVAAVADARDPDALAEIGVQNVDAAVVCIGGRTEELGILVSAQLLEAGVKNVVTRCNSRVVETVLKRIGVKSVFYVESAMGKIVAHRLLRPGLSQEMDLGGGKVLVEWEVPYALSGKSLVEITGGERSKVQVVAVRRQREALAIRYPEPAMKVTDQDRVLLAGNEEDLNEFFEHWREEL